MFTRSHALPLEPTRETYKVPLDLIAHFRRPNVHCSLIIGH